MPGLLVLLSTTAGAVPLDPAAFASLGVLAPAGPITIDTDLAQISGAASAVGVVDGDVTVFTFDEVRLDDLVTVVGARPVAILSRGALSVGATGVVVASADLWHAGPGGYDGARFTPADGPCPYLCPSIQGHGPGRGDGTEDGGGGGGHGGAGGNAGDCTEPVGSACWHGEHGGEAYGEPVFRLQGGSGGGVDAEASESDMYGRYDLYWGGGGGGAVELGALGAVDLAGIVDVDGADGGGESRVGYSGGGAGGAILVHGRGGAVTGTLLARGGDGQSVYGWLDLSGAGGGGGGRVTVRGLDLVSGVLDASGGAGGTGGRSGEAGDDGVTVIDGDYDLLDDGLEVTVYGTDPTRLDTDQGSVHDGVEVLEGTDPTWGGDDDAAPDLVRIAGGGHGVQILEAGPLTDGLPVRLAVGRGGGTVPLPGCPGVSVLAVGPPFQVVDETLPASGVATLSVLVPPGVVGTRYVQAFQPLSCRVTGVLALSFCDDAGGDSDGDLLCDPVEAATGTDPTDDDSDDDGRPDGEEDTSGDGAVDAGETDPRAPDTDGDGVCDGYRADGDGDGLDPADACRSEGHRRIAVGARTTCGIRQHGELACAGDDFDELLSPPAGAFVDLTVGVRHACALDADGAVTCWGQDVWALLDAPEGTFSAVDAGATQTCAIDASTQAVTCWGEVFAGTPPSHLRFDRISVGDEHACGVRQIGTLTCWGADGHGQSTPPAGTWAAVSVGKLHTCAIDVAGGLACWGITSGAGDYGQVTDAPTTGTWVDVSAGDFHTCALDTAGAVTCWGRDDVGQSTPPAGTFAALAASTYHPRATSCAVDPAGALTCWGQAAAEDCVDLDACTVEACDLVWYADADGDGYGDATAPVVACAAGPTHVDNDLDCDDADPLTGAECCVGAHTFGAEAQAVQATATGPHRIVPGDLDLDGDADLVAIFDSSGAIEWFENLGGGALAEGDVLALASASHGELEVIDLDGDRLPDLLRCGGGTVSFHQNLGGGRFAAAITLPSTPYLGCESVVAADLDGDDDLDAAVTSGENTIRWFENLGGGAFGADRFVSQSAGEDPYALAAGDLDGDGDVDLVATQVRQWVEDAVSWFENRGGGTFAPRQVLDMTAGDPLNITAGDLDGDGDLDLVVGATEFDIWGVGAGGVFRMENLGGGTFGPLYKVPGSDWAFDLTLADLDRDADLDVVTSSSVGGYAGAGFHWLENRGGFVFTSHSVPAGVGASTVGVADLDGDGVLDVATGWDYDDVIRWIPGACP